MRRASTLMVRCSRSPSSAMDVILDEPDLPNRLDKDIIEPLSIIQTLIEDSSFIKPHLAQLLGELFVHVEHDYIPPRIVSIVVLCMQSFINSKYNDIK